MGFSFSDFAASLKAGARIDAADVLEVRRWVWPDGAVSDAEAEAVFELNRLARESDPEWDDFLIEAMTDYVVNAKLPKGYVDEANAAWLIGQIERDGAPVTQTEVKLVVKLLEKALNCPASLKAWALRQIEESVCRDKAVGESEAELLRRIVFAAGGDGALKVGDEEAETLWRIKDCCLGGANAPAWKTLFVQALGNHLMAWSSYRPLEREDAARLEAFMDDRRSNLLGFLGRMSAAGAVREAFAKAPMRNHESEVAAERAVTGNEQAWLDHHVQADGAEDEFETALRAFLAEESRG